jgi:hypothetical protein
MTTQEALSYLKFRLAEFQSKNNAKEIARYETLIQAFISEHKLN